MNNIRRTIEIILKRNNPEEILKKYFNEDKRFKIESYIKNEQYLDANRFKSAFRNDFENIYNNDEVENIYDLYNKGCNSKDSGFIFNTLCEFTKNVLTEKEGIPICKYEQLLRWRELSFQLGEDILTTSYLAKQDCYTIKERKYFSWAPIILTDNIKLRKMLEKGMAENHFHLGGSAQYFRISWIAIMNNPKLIEKYFSNLEKGYKLGSYMYNNFNEEKISLKLLLKKASIIRLVLSKIINNDYSNNIKEKVRLKTILLCNSCEEFKLFSNNNNYDIEVEKYLKGNKFEEEVADYLITKDVYEFNKNSNVFFSGERKFLYSLFKKIYSEDEEFKKYKGLVYVYILIKNIFREEMIQTNRRFGFSNFSDYQSRKKYFITKNSIYDKALLATAVNTSLENQSIKSLEVRIGPKEYQKKYFNLINGLDNLLNARNIFLTSEDVFLKEVLYKKEFKYFYTIHFKKEAEDKFRNDLKSKLYNSIHCRNYKLREKVKKQGQVLKKIKESSTCSIKKRILGIDAASVEIGCRPEVFSLVYGSLKNIGKTYHVGEEFLDLVDGLRAIDECIKFLQFSQGDRLGHALALGINAKEYYQVKENILVLPKHEVLDNIAWLLGRISETGIECSDKLLYKLKTDYRKFFHEIYEKNCEEVSNYSYHSYYDSWKLRGDSPRIYFNISNECNEITKDIENSFLVKYNEVINTARNNFQARRLYHEYHYNSKAKAVGGEIVQFKVDINYVKLVEKIQRSLQFEIAKKNIFIETNPTSNYLIGTFKKYINHPIRIFFNLGLEIDSNKIKECPQISVSINTDDQGVFGTYLENEYALLSLALAKEKDANGENIYNQTMIYDWLDRVREMGLEQSFK